MSNSHFERISRWVDERAEHFVQQLVDLLRIDTTNPPGSGYPEMVAYLEERLRRFGLHTERVEVPAELITPPMEGPRINLVARYNNGKRPLGVYAHMDTVPVEGDWDHDPWGEVSEGRIWGRGASDLKSSIAAYLGAMEAIHALGLEPTYDVVGLMCTDEEVSHPNAGVLYLARQGYVPHELLCLESGQDPFLVEGFVGNLTWEVSVRGVACHSGKSYEGVNALEQAFPILQELLELKRVVEQRESRYGREPSKRAPSTRRTPRLNLNVIRSNGKHNMIPSLCVISGDRRYIPEENVEEVEAELRAAVERARSRIPEARVELQIKRGYPPMTVDIDGPVAQKMKQVLKLGQGYKDEDFCRFISFGSSDMALLQQLTGSDQMAIFGVGRDGEGNFHAPNENVRISDLLALIKELTYYFTTP
ncbi:MAG: M20 family metallopeptidase [Symbiobacterium sp.]|uniref:M20 family metallopeptidase n=1 Tax=Symbiobacterium sp. TaxID=1971213 RepID=UPI003464A2AE